MQSHAKDPMRRGCYSLKETIKNRARRPKTLRQACLPIYTAGKVCFLQGSFAAAIKGGFSIVHDAHQWTNTQCMCVTRKMELR